MRKETAGSILHKYFKHLTLITLFIFTVIKSDAQASLSSTKKINALKEIKVGETVPDFELKNVLNYRSSYLKLDDFKGKAVILDFWATWCAPCIQMIPFMEQLQRQYPDDLTVIMVSYDKAGSVKSFFQKAPVKYKTTMICATENDSLLNVFLTDYFPHNIIPHYVWIGKDNTVKAITGENEVTNENIKKFVNNEPLNLIVKKDPVPDKPSQVGSVSNYNKWSKEIFRNDKSDSADFAGIKYLSLLNGYIDGFPRNFSGRYFMGTKYEFRRIRVNNAPWIWMYKLAYGEPFPEYSFDCPNNRIVFDIKDTVRFSRGNEIFTDTSRLYCYNLIIPESNKTLLFKTMQQDIQKYFGAKATIEKRMTKCFALVVTDTTKLRTKGGQPASDYNQLLWVKISNKPLANLVRILIYCNENSYDDTPVLLDETNWNGNVDIDITANLTDYAALKEELIKYGLDLVEKERLLDIVVVTDK